MKDIGRRIDANTGYSLLVSEDSGIPMQGMRYYGVQR